ncbi:tyrosine-type recombinase/integrase [Clostridium sp. HBUAS56010]|uniref:tyrosine-type recombinase/integrase n=1 Tax=Clostridium sp. HBUAS56010 TaxID=2571127 RepID=UPI0011789DAA|nr:tyrosine-type recombinase/integrase [Clostridium sp. HBUAS56010]
MRESQSYRKQQDKKNDQKVKEIIADLPEFCLDFFIGIEPRTSSNTRLSYAYDVVRFFSFLGSVLSVEVKDVTLQQLESLKVQDFENYMSYLKTKWANSERGISRKINALKSFYRYFYRSERMEKNVMDIVETPKLHEKPIVYLKNDEAADLIESVKENVQSAQKWHTDKNNSRDIAIIMLLLGTGIRVSECVGLDIQDVELSENRINVIRKGGKESHIYFSDDVCEVMRVYIEERKHLENVLDENALFISLHKRRISVRAVENLVKKYASSVTDKKIGPHKLRATFATHLYRETGDISLVAENLGHSDINTTKRHYAALEDERKKSTRNLVRYNEEDSEEK